MQQMDPGRLPYRQLIEEAHRKEREREARAQLHARQYPDDEEPTDSGRGLRRVLRRLRNALKRRG